MYPERWVYVSTEFGTEQEMARAEGIAQTAAAHGLNGMLLSAGLDSLCLKPPQYFRRLEH